MKLWPLLVLACGCFSAQPDKSRFFVLTGSGPPPRAAVDGRKPILGLGPIALPEYLDRPELVMRRARNELRISPTDRWAEPLASGFARTLQHDVETQLRADSVVLYPWQVTSPPPLEVKIEILRFERIGTGEVELSAQWTLREVESGRVLVTREASIRRAVARNDSDAAVAALSETVAVLGRQIADAVTATGMAARTP